MENVIIVLILVAAVGYGIYSFIHHLRHGGGCCGEHDAPAKKVRAADTNKSHYPHRLVMGVDGMTCQNCQRHVENALNTLPDTLAEVNLSARNVMVWTKADADEEVIRKAIRDAGYLPLRTQEKGVIFGHAQPLPHYVKKEQPLMMINKRLISMMGDSKRYIAWNVVLQFLALLANIVMIFAVSRLLAGLLDGTPDLPTALLYIFGALIVRFFCTRGAASASYNASCTVKKRCAPPFMKNCSA